MQKLFESRKKNERLTWRILMVSSPQSHFFLGRPNLPSISPSQSSQYYVSFVINDHILTNRCDCYKPESELSIFCITFLSPYYNIPLLKTFHLFPKNIIDRKFKKNDIHKHFKGPQYSRPEVFFWTGDNLSFDNFWSP